MKDFEKRFFEDMAASMQKNGIYESENQFYHIKIIDKFLGMYEVEIKNEELLDFSLDEKGYTSNNMAIRSFNKIKHHCNEKGIAFGFLDDVKEIISDWEDKYNLPEIKKDLENVYNRDYWYYAVIPNENSYDLVSIDELSYMDFLLSY